jgi:hypothetical protein
MTSRHARITLVGTAVATPAKAGAFAIATRGKHRPKSPGFGGTPLHVVNAVDGVSRWQFARSSV